MGTFFVFVAAWQGFHTLLNIEIEIESSIYVLAYQLLLLFISLLLYSMLLGVLFLEWCCW